MARATEPRDERILGLLEGNEQVSVGSLAQHLGVSEVTVRKDLDRLARRALVERVRGGARLPAGEEGALSERLGHRAAAKRAMAKRAALMIEPGAVIALDSSSTGYYLALELALRRDLTIVTNSLRIAMQLAEQSAVDIVLLGGSVRRTSASTVGFPLELLQQFGRIDIAFLGASAMSAEQGLLERAYSEAETKRMMASVAERVIGLVDSSKATGFGQHRVVPPTRLERLITDDALTDDAVTAWGELGVAVDRVSLTPGEHR